MIIIDFNQVVLASFFAAVKQHTNIAIETSMVRRMTLNSMLGILRKFKNHEVVIASDSRQTWRLEYFPHYKATRKANREESDVNWADIYSSLNTIREELQEHFPYTFIQVDGCEGDDIIGTLCLNLHEGRDFTTGDLNSETIIVSRDKDFKQLQRYPQVSQYDSVNNKWLKESDGASFLEDHIIRGDRDDGIPNILSDDDTFVDPNKRQGRMTQKRFDELWGCIQDDPNHKYYRNYIRNKTLIDLTMTPENLQREIMKIFHDGPLVKDKSKLMPYMAKHRLSSLLEHLNDF